ncbi:hypothetical protein C2862_21200 [Massilia sp. Mn16-1_5]|nr:hypothetical protein C2862_21200 [Massilia sp. Mn16-1_5]
MNIELFGQELYRKQMPAKHPGTKQLQKSRPIQIQGRAILGVDSLKKRLVISNITQEPWIA